MNEFTRDALQDAFKKNKKLHEKRFDLIVRAAHGSYWDNLHGMISYQFMIRAIHLYYQFAPDCVTAEGLTDNYVDCDYCAQMLAEHVTEFMFWWVRQHPEYAFTDFTLEDEQVEHARFLRLETAERNRGKVVQLSLFGVTA